MGEDFSEFEDLFETASLKVKKQSTYGQCISQSELESCHVSSNFHIVTILKYWEFHESFVKVFKEQISYKPDIF